VRQCGLSVPPGSKSSSASFSSQAGAECLCSGFFLALRKLAIITQSAIELISRASNSKMRDKEDNPLPSRTTMSVASKEGIRNLIDLRQPGGDTLTRLRPTIDILKLLFTDATARA
jgi:hypothetical protein